MHLIIEMGYGERALTRGGITRGEDLHRGSSLPHALYHVRRDTRRSSIEVGSGELHEEP